jgi:hypothetical protein
VNKQPDAPLFGGETSQNNSLFGGNMSQTQTGQGWNNSNTPDSNSQPKYKKEDVEK